jgi:hypothetical protein
MRQTDRFIRWYDEALAVEVCREIIERFDRDKRTMTGLVAGNRGPEFEPLKQTTELVLPDDGWTDIKQTLQQNLFDYCARYQAATRFLIGSEHKDIVAEPLRVKKYEKGGQFHWHIDSSSGPTISRCLAVQWYFNTVEEGGCTEFEDQDADIAPVEGRIAFFPVGWMYRHRGAPPLSGPKYVCTTFLHPKL